MASRPFLKHHPLSPKRKLTFNTVSTTGVESTKPCLCWPSMPGQGRLGLSTGVSPSWIGTACVNPPRALRSFAHLCCAKRARGVASHSEASKSATVCSRSLSTVRVGTLYEVSFPNRKRNPSALQAKKANKPSAVLRNARVVPYGKQLDRSQQTASSRLLRTAWVGKNPTGWSPCEARKANLVRSNGKRQEVGSTPRKGVRAPEEKQTTQKMSPSVKVPILKQVTVPTTANTLGVVRSNTPFNFPFNLSSNQKGRLGAQGGFNKTQTRSPICFDKAKTGVIYLYCTSNNTVCTLVDSKGVTKGWTSCGSMGFKSARKSTAYASQATAERIGLKAKEIGFKWAFLVLKGIGRGKESGVRALRKSGVEILGVLEKTGISHNGCRPPKKRRV